MARVRAFSVPGVRLVIYSGDHEPPHLHARKPGHWEAKVYFLESEVRMIELVRPPDAKMSRADRRRIIAGVRMHRPGLLAEWEAAQADE
jgi:hypothetical protein